MRLFSNRSQMTSRCGTRAASECVTDVFTTFWRLLWSITEQTDGNIKSICSIQWSEKKKGRYTYQPRTAWLFEDLCNFKHFSSPKCYFSSLLLLFSFILLVKVSSKRVFHVFTFSTQNNGENFLQNSESLIAMSHDQLLWSFLAV